MGKPQAIPVPPAKRDLFTNYRITIHNFTTNSSVRIRELEIKGVGQSGWVDMTMQIATANSYVESRKVSSLFFVEPSLPILNMSGSTRTQLEIDVTDKERLTIGPVQKIPITGTNFPNFANGTDGCGDTVQENRVFGQSRAPIYKYGQHCRPANTL